MAYPAALDTNHSFYPLEIVIPGYVENDLSVVQLLAIFGAVWATVIISTAAAIGQYVPDLNSEDRTSVLWFVFTGSMHLFFEGYYSINHARMGGMQDIFGQLWKEYSLSDSRYQTSDPFILCVESITAFLWGPLSFVIAWCIVSRHPLRYPLQSLVSMGQIFGTVLYFVTNMTTHHFQNVSYCRPEPYYFWFYYVFMNVIWIVVPAYYLHQGLAASTIALAVASQHRPYVNDGGKKKVNEC